MGKTALLDENPQIWETRWTVMSKLIGHMAATLPADLAHRDTFAHLLGNLQAFGQGQFSYFYTKLTNGEPAPDGFSQQYALSQTLDQIGRDMTLIGLAIHQREATSPREVRDSLRLTDDFAAAVLKPAQRYLGGDSKVITYLNKSDLTRVLPYAPVALVGVPFSTVNLDDGQPRAIRDFLAIPHEVGHYVYWHGKTQNSGPYNGMRFCWALPHQIKHSAVANWAAPWAEEVFADTYGARTAGPMITVDFQELLIERDSDQDFTGNNGEHPTSFIRPEGYCTTLDAIGLNEWADQMRAAWVEKRRRIVPDNAPLLLNHGQTVSHAEASAQLERMTQAANSLIPKVNFDAQRAHTLFNDIGSASDKNDLIYRVWLDVLRSEGGTRGLPGGAGNAPAAFSWADWKAALLADVAIVADLEKGTAPEWNVVLGAGGWVDGPGGSPPVR